MAGKLRNIAAVLRFDGTAYHGWQVQANARSVQPVFQDALETVLRVRPDVTGCSRTDAGVHARMYVCNFRIRSAIPCEGLLLALNRALPRDIAVRECREVPDMFHARYAACGKEYAYRILTGPARDPFWERYALHWPYPTDADAMRRAAGLVPGTHDFGSFCAAGGSVEDHVRTVTRCTVEREGELLVLRVRADGFLYHMVRILAGTLLKIGRGALPAEGMADVIAAQTRAAAGPTAPAAGLCLERVFYGPSWGDYGKPKEGAPREQDAD